MRIPKDDDNTAQRETVLVVDDEPQTQALVQSLSDEGYKVEIAHDGVEAIALAEQLCPAATLLDMRLPDMDGMQTLRELRRRGHDGAVILLTSKGSVDSAREAMELGAHDYITKPFGLDVVKATLRDGILSRSDRRRFGACVR